MKATNSILLIIIASTLALAGCGKSGKDKFKVSTPISPVLILRNAFPSPGPEVAPSVEKINFAIRHGDQQTALSELEKLSAIPNLTPAQKKAVGDATDRVKESIATAASSQ